MLILIRPSNSDRLLSATAGSMPKLIYREAQWLAINELVIFTTCLRRTLNIRRKQKNPVT